MKGPPDILRPLFSRKTDLGEGVSGAMQHVNEEGNLGKARDFLRQQERLIELPCPEADWMERDGGDPIELNARQLLSEQAGQWVGQCGLFLIFEALDRFGEDSLVRIRGQGA